MFELISIKFPRKNHLNTQWGLGGWGQFFCLLYEKQKLYGQKEHQKNLKTS